MHKGTNANAKAWNNLRFSRTKGIAPLSLLLFACLLLNHVLVSVFPPKLTLRLSCLPLCLLALALAYPSHHHCLSMGVGLST